MELIKNSHINPIDIHHYIDEQLREHILVGVDVRVYRGVSTCFFGNVNMQVFLHIFGEVDDIS